jgi:hypothetical protein
MGVYVVRFIVEEGVVGQGDDSLLDKGTDLHAFLHEVLALLQKLTNKSLT